MTMFVETDFDDQKLFELVSKVDEYYWKDGINFSARELKVYSDVMSAFGYSSFEYGYRSPPLLARIKACRDKIYNGSTGSGSGSIGIFCFRDVIVRISIPLIVGRAAIDPLNNSNLTEGQKIIMRNDNDLLRTYYDQFWDCWDIFQWYFSPPNMNVSQTANKFIGLAVTHQHSAAAILASSFDSQGAIQNSVLSCELALKACLLSLGQNESDLRSKRFGHKLSNMIDFIKSTNLAMDFGRLERIIEILPDLVKNRYGEQRVPETLVGQLVMKTQFFLSEVVRALTGRSIRDEIEGWTSERVFPS